MVETRLETPTSSRQLYVTVWNRLDKSITLPSFSPVATAYVRFKLHEEATERIGFEVELLAALESIRNWRPYLWGRHFICLWTTRLYAGCTRCRRQWKAARPRV